MAKKYLIGNAQTIGSCEEQSNYFAIVDNDSDELLAVLADGTIDHPNGRKAAILAVRYCIEEFKQNKLNSQEHQKMLGTALQASRYIQERIYIGKSPRVSLTMVILKAQTLQYFNVGNNRLYLYDGHRERIIDHNTTKPYTSGKYDLKPKTVLGIMSAGAGSVTHPAERIKIVGTKGKSTYDKAQAIIKIVESRGRHNRKNATVLLIEHTS